MRWMLPAIMSLVSVLPALAQQGAERAELIRQVEASDAIARALERAPSLKGPSTSPSTQEAPPAYDQLLRGAIADLPEDIPESADLSTLNDYQLRQALVVMQLNNIQRYVELSRQSSGIGNALQPEIEAAATQPSRSATLTRYLRNEPEPEVTHAQQLPGRAEGGSEESMEEGSAGESAAVAVMSGRSSLRSFALPSTVAPLDAKRPGSQVIEAVLPRALPLANDVPRSVALRADPAGNPREVIPSPEEISRVAAVAGVGFEVAEQLIRGSISLADVSKSRSTLLPDELVGGLKVDDPRWSNFYYGPKVSIFEWAADIESAFEFQSGGGRYERSDRRVNADFDMRTNGDIDRRVNSIFDRRLDSRVDPRANY